MAERGLIPQTLIDEVRARADLVDVVGETVQLKKAGREFKARCPFHDEKTPSFYVVPDKGFYKCFGCGKSGSVFDFVMEHLGMDFVEAVEYVAGRVGVELRREDRVRPEDDPHRPFYEVTAFAQSWFRERFLHDADGAVARDYLEKRGVGQDVAERFGIGYAPDEWRALREVVQKHGFDERTLLELGLLKESEKSREPYDGFRGRVMFPIESVGGKVVAFGGRVMSGSGPKYINSPESPIFSKGRELYGLSWAKHAIRRAESVLVVEGYMDVVSLAAGGFENVVAPLGTALTEEQAVRLGRYAPKAFLLFDSDRAGLIATFKTGDLLLEAGVTPMVVTLPDGHDPDTIIREEGADALRRLLDDASDVLERKIQMLQQGGWFDSIDRKRIAVDKLLPTLRAVTDPALRDLYIGRTADVTGVRQQTLEAEVQRLRETGRRDPRSRPDAGARPPRSVVQGVSAPMGAERQLLKAMVRGVEWVERAVELIAPEDFMDPTYRAIFRALLDDPEMRTPPTAMDRLAALRFEEILDEDPGEFAHGIEVFTESVNRIRVLALDRRIQDLQHRIIDADDESEERELVAEKTQLAAELRELDPTYWKTATRRPFN